MGGSGIQGSVGTCVTLSWPRVCVGGDTCDPVPALWLWGHTSVPPVMLFVCDTGDKDSHGAM